MANKNEGCAFGSFLTILQVTFVLIRAFNLVNWSWWVVFIPTYVMIFSFIFAIIVVIFLEILDGK